MAKTNTHNIIATLIGKLFVFAMILAAIVKIYAIVGVLVGCFVAWKIISKR